MIIVDKSWYFVESCVHSYHQWFKIQTEIFHYRNSNNLRIYICHIQAKMSFLNIFIMQPMLVIQPVKNSERNDVAANFIEKKKKIVWRTFINSLRHRGQNFMFGEKQKRFVKQNVKKKKECTSEWEGCGGWQRRIRYFIYRGERFSRHFYYTFASRSAPS